MTKRFKLRLSFPSFQFCRLRLPSSLPQTPSPETYQFSPVNPKAFDIVYPNVPKPPPPTPNHLSFTCLVSPAKIIPVGCGRRSRSCSQKNASQCNTKSPVRFNWEEQSQHKLYNSSVSDISDSDTRPVRLAKARKMMTEGKKKDKASACISTSSADSGGFSTEGSDYSEESESLISSSRSFEYSGEFGYSLETISERPITRGRRKKKTKKSLKVRRLKCYVSNSWKGGEKTKTTTPENLSPVRSSVFRRLIPCAVDGKVGKESFALVKRSEDPYEDFKKSMLEMILEKQMFDDKDLEQLLQCFLSLNSQHHHATIVRAFAEVWEVLFCKSPNSQRV